MRAGLKSCHNGRLRIYRWSGHAKALAQANVASLFWPRVSQPISFFWMKGRRVASRRGGSCHYGCLGVLEAGARRGLVSDLRQAHIDLLRQGIRFDIGLLQDSLTRLGLSKL